MSNPFSTAPGKEVLGGVKHPPLSGTYPKPPVLGREDWNRRYGATEFIWTAHPNRFFVEEAATLPRGSALELAAGEGRNSVWLAEQGWAVRAVDFSEVALQKAAQLAATRGVADRLHFELADLHGHEPEAGRYDLVALIYLQLPQVELVPILRKAAGALAPGGTLLVIAHDSANLTQGYGGPQHPALLYSAEDVVAALGGALQVETAKRIERTVETLSGPKTALDCLVRARRP